MVSNAKPYETPMVSRSGDVVERTRTKTTGIAESVSPMLFRNGVGDVGFGL